jgi:hypothetical protein
VVDLVMLSVNEMEADVNLVIAPPIKGRLATSSVNDRDSDSEMLMSTKLETLSVNDIDSEMLMSTKLETLSANDIDSDSTLVVDLVIVSVNEMDSSGCSCKTPLAS